MFKIIRLCLSAVLFYGFSVGADVIYLKDGSIIENADVKARDKRIAIIDVEKDQTRLIDNSVVNGLPEFEPRVDLEKIAIVDTRNNYAISVSNEIVHIGDNSKNMFVPKKPIGIKWEKEFYLAEIPEDAKLAMEVIWSDSDSPVYLNGRKIGFVPAKPKKKWRKDYDRFKKKIPLKYGEIPIPDNVLKVGRNLLRIESYKGKKFFMTNYDDFVLRYVRIVR